MPAETVAGRPRGARMDASAAASSCSTSPPWACAARPIARGAEAPLSLAGCRLEAPDRGPCAERCGGAQGRDRLALGAPSRPTLRRGRRSTRRGDRPSAASATRARDAADWLPQSEVRRFRTCQRVGAVRLSLISHGNEAGGQILSVERRDGPLGLSNQPSSRLLGRVARRTRALPRRCGQAGSRSAVPCSGVAPPWARTQG